jgi:hypothetical protein
MSFNNVDNGTIDVNNVTIDGDPANAGAVGVHIEDSDATFDFDSATTIQDFAGTNFEVDGGEGVITFAGEIDNTVAGGGRSVHITDLQGGSVTFSPASMITDTNTGILVDANDDGLILFAGELDMDTAGNDAITLTNNTGTDIDFTGLVDINTTGGDGFTATGGGNLTVTGTTNRIQTDTGQIAVITGMTIDAGGVNFGFADRNMAAATSAIQLENNVGTGAIVFGSAANQTAGDNGTIVGGGADTILVRNTANATFNALIVNNAATFSGFRVDKTNNNSMNVTVNDTTINDGAFGVNVTGNGTTGNLNMTIADVDILDSTTAGLSFDDVDAGTINVNNTTIDGNNASAGGQGVIIANSNATFNFDSSTVIQEFGGTDFEVDGGTPVVSFAGDIINRSDVNAADTTGRSVDVNSITGGSVTFTAASSIRDDNQGLIVGGPLAADGNSGGVISFLGTMEFDTVAADAVTVQNNTGTTNVIFDGLDIVTTTGDGVLITSNASTTSVMITDVDVTTTTGNAFTATSGGNLTVAGANNVITTTTGTGLTIDGMNIVTQASFESVTVNGAANGIVLENVTGAQVTVGETAGAADSGGTLTTTAEAIIVRNVQNADLNNIRVADSGADAVVIEHTGAGTTNMDVTVDSLNLDAATGDGVAVAYQSNTNDFVLRFVDSTLEENFVASVTGNNLFQMRVENTDINVAGTTDAFATTFSGSATDAELILRNVNFTATDASAAFIDASGGTAKTVDLLIEDSSFENSSAGNPSVEINSQGSSTMNATIQGNTFDNAAGTDFDISSDGAAARMRLNLGGDPASPSDFNTAAGGGQFELFENGGSDFDVFEMVDTFGNLRNNGTVDGNGGTYDDLPVAPVPPVIP